MSLVMLLRETGRAIAYRPKLAKLFGGATAEIFFEQIFYWQDKANSDLGVYKTQAELEDETGLSRNEQETARKKLRNIGVLIETHKRLEHRIYYKIDEEKLEELLATLISNPVNSGEINKPNLANVENQQPRMLDSNIREEGKPAFVNTLDYNTRLQQENNNPLPPSDEFADDEINPQEDIKPERQKIDYQAILDFYNAENERNGKRLPSAIDINDKRKRGIKKILNLLKTRTLEAFNAYIERFFESAPEFYFGANDRKWKANFDYLLREDTLTKVREGAL
ncbi:DNA replication protein [Gallibacterium salpingitidis]|uniref:DNA replication protein n=1 Tax=Gallibacterium salpingitidis TaxID=505341 RepID=UPI00266F7D52|nr:DNA replication protein [Gallibacterium salpingitidis]WKT00506.1 DNA replication protein [Gallibacterium salpingitidis]